MIHKKIVIRICLIYLCVLLPLLGTNVFVVKSFLNKIQLEEEAKLYNQLYAMADMLSADFTTYKNKGVILFENEKFSSNLRLKDPVEISEAIHALSELQIFDESGTEILVYYGEEKLYTSNGDVKLKVYFEQTLGCTKQSAEDAIAAVSMSSYAIKALNGKNGLEYILFHVPVGKDLYGYNHSMEVILKLSELEKMLEAVLSNDNLIVELELGEKKNFFYYAESKCRLLTENAAEEIMTQYDNEPLEQVCKDLDINIRIWYDIKNQLQEFYQLRNINLFLFSIGLLLSVVVSVALSIARFSRLKDILENIFYKKEVNQEKHHWKKNEFDYIQLAVNETIKENNDALMKEKQYRKALLNQVAKSIFYGGVKERNEIQTILRLCGMELYEEYFFVLGISVRALKEIEKLDELFLEDIYFTTSGEKLVFILKELPFEDSDMKKRHEMAKQLKDIFITAGISCNHIAMSKVYSQISMANHAYLEVANMLEKGLGKKQKTECWEEWVLHNKEYGDIWSENTQMESFCEAMGEEKDNPADNIDNFEKVIQFVIENYTNYELSLIMVAEYAELSKSKTSRLFKQCTGEAYIDYVTRLRMEKIKELLEKTDMNVKDILQQVGYLDVTNASKKFKAYFKMNPSAYRTQVRKQKGEKEA